MKVIRDKASAIASAVRDARRQPGQVLPNGATILKQVLVKEGEFGNEYVVLAVTTGYQPFITWHRVIGVEQMASGYYGPLDYCIWGHYFKDLEDAVADFDLRRAKAEMGIIEVEA